MDDLLRPGQNAKLQRVRQEDTRVRLSVTGAAPLRLLGVLLDDRGRAVTVAPLLTWRQPTEQVQINLSKGETIGALLHTAAIMEPIQSIMFIAAPYGREFFLSGERMFTAIASEGAEPMAIESMAPDDGMRAIVLCEFYRHPDEGVKIRARSEWRHREITLLLERLGVSTKIITDQMLYPLPQARHTDAERASLNDMIAPAEVKRSSPPPPPKAAVDDNLSEPRAAIVPDDHAPNAIFFEEAGAQYRFSAPDGKFGPVVFNFTWHQRLATRAAVHLDLGVFYELQTGEKGQLEGLSDRHGSISVPPYVALSGEMRRAAAQCSETININGDQWGNIRRILLYAMIHDGPTDWDPLDARLTLSIPGQPGLSADLIAKMDHKADAKAGPIAALLLLENRSDQMRVVYPGGFFESHYALDANFDFQLRWQSENNRPRDAASEHDWAPPAPLGFWRKWLGTLFGTTTYNNAEDLMSATLAASAMVMVADGRVNMDERKHTVDAIMRLPIGKMFAEYEVRETMEKILRDLKHRRREAERLTLSLLSHYRGHADARMIVEAMRRAAMVDGQVNIQEERMVERLTRYLKSERAA